MNSPYQYMPITFINDFIESELLEFSENYRVRPIPREQELRAFSIAWLCTFFTKWISQENIKRIHSFVLDAQKEKDYEIHGWYRIPALQTATFKLTNDEYQLDNLLRKLSCDQGDLRELMVTSTAFISTDISFDNRTLLSSTQHNVEKVHGLHGENIILCLCTKGDAQEKMKWLSSIKHIHPDYKPLADFISNLLVGPQQLNCSYFATQFAEIKTYLLFKMLSRMASFEYIRPEEQEQKVIYREVMNHFYESEKSHPLSDCYIDLSYLKE